MKSFTKFFFIVLLSVNSLSALNTERIFESLYLVDANYFYGDDGVDCHTTFQITKIEQSRFPDALEVFYEAQQDYFVHGCQERGIPCKILMRSTDFFPIEESLECEDSWWE
jgi:hypothetical protein